MLPSFSEFDVNWGDLALVFAGSGLGGASRFLVSRVMAQHTTTQLFPWSTFIINVTGCLLIGILYAFAARYSSISRGLLLFLSVGFSGGFTTFSTFMNENYILFQGGNLWYAILYWSASTVCGFLALYLGYYCAARL